MKHLKTAINEWQNTVGTDNVTTQRSILVQLQRATFPTSQNVLALVRPGNKTELQECIKIANKHKIPIYPISCGKNWGLGSRVPIKDESVIFDLGRLNKIVDFDGKLAHVTVEPGVTFQQLSDFLKANQSNLFLSVIGGSPDASVLGNIVERGDGLGPYGERLTFISSLQIILATGEVISTGFGRFANSRLTKLDRFGIGPYLDGIFTQSNLGIIISATLWLMPIPEFFQILSFSLRDDEKLESTIDILQPLILRNLIQPNCVSIWNNYKSLASEKQYPFEEQEGKVPLSPKDLLKLSDPKKVFSWYGNAAIYSSSKEQGLAERNILKKQLKTTTPHMSFTDSERHPELLQQSLYLGVPSQNSIKGAYWRKKKLPKQEIDLDRDQCGIISLCFSMPFEGTIVKSTFEIVSDTFLMHLFEPNVAFVFPSARSIRIVANVVYDREEPDEDELALACYNDCFNKLLLSGLLPYRLGIQAMSFLAVEDDYSKLIRKLKHIMDPNNIIAPGRYDTK